VTQQAQSVVEVAEKYYDSNDADQFYFNIWGGEDIHIGLYDGEKDPIVAASKKTVERIASMIQGLGQNAQVLDIGAGYGGAGRYLARTHGCHVACLNLSETQNARNRKLSNEQGLGELIEVVHANFEEIPKPDQSYDVVWSQDAILHSGNRKKVLQEVARVLRPGGQFIFTDPMQADDVPDQTLLAPVLERIHLDSLGSFRFYREAARELGLEEVECVNLTEQLVRHYGRVREELTSRYDEMIKLSSAAYVDRMIQGLGHWVDAGKKGYLAWGILHFKKP
jgi:sarcosine/dimethylglycine N-methyltransferase